VRVSHLLQDRNLSVYPLDIRLVFDFVLLQDLNGNFVTCYYMCTLFDLAECAFTLCFSDDEASDLLAFLVLLLLRILLFLRSLLRLPAISSRSSLRGSRFISSAIGRLSLVSWTIS